MQAGTQHPRQCQCHTRLAHLLRAGTEPHRHGSLASRHRTLCARSEGDGRRARCHHDRPVSVGVPVGAVSHDQQRHKLHTLWTCAATFRRHLYQRYCKLHEVNVLDQLVPEPGAFYVMDRAISCTSSAWAATTPRQLLSSCAPNPISKSAPLLAEGRPTHRSDLTKRSCSPAITLTSASTRRCERSAPGFLSRARGWSF